MSPRRFSSHYNVVSALAGFLIFFAAGCSGSSKPSTHQSAPPAVRLADEPAPPPKAEIPTHAYRGDRFADPFVPLSIDARSAAMDELAIPNINSLSLKGIYLAGARAIAILSGGGAAYTVKGNRLYDSRERQIPGFWCVIKSESVVISAGGINREIKLRE